MLIWQHCSPSLKYSLFYLKILHMKSIEPLHISFVTSHFHASLKTNRTTLVSAPLRQFGSCFRLFNMAGFTQYKYIVGKYKIHLHTMRISIAMLAQRLTFLPVSKVRTNKCHIFQQCMYIVYVLEKTSLSWEICV